MLKRQKRAGIKIISLVFKDGHKQLIVREKKEMNKKRKERINLLFKRWISGIQMKSNLFLWDWNLQRANYRMRSKWVCLKKHQKPFQTGKFIHAVLINGDFSWPFNSTEPQTVNTTYFLLWNICRLILEVSFFFFF